MNDEKSGPRENLDDLGNKPSTATQSPQSGDSQRPMSAISSPRPSRAMSNKNPDVPAELDDKSIVSSKSKGIYCVYSESKYFTPPEKNDRYSEIDPVYGLNTIH